MDLGWILVRAVVVSCRGDQLGAFVQVELTAVRGGLAGAPTLGVVSVGQPATLRSLFLRDSDARNSLHSPSSVDKHSPHE